jgi:hypothetical protein
MKNNIEILRYVILYIMVSFLRLTTVVINLAHIKHIDIKNGAYNVHLTDNKITGSYNIFKLGYIATENTVIEISRKSNPVDYATMSYWIDKLPN